VDPILTADGFEEAFIGCCARTNRAIYSYEKCLDVLMDGDSELTRDDAIEHMEFNVVGSYMGEGTPIFLLDMPHEYFQDMHSDE